MLALHGRRRDGGMGREEGFVGLTVFTNLGTRFVLAAVRMQTFVELKEILKELHLFHFPEWGEVTIAELWVEVFSHKYRIVESTTVGGIYNQAEGLLEALVSLQNGGPRAMDTCPVQTILSANSWTNFSTESSMLPCAMYNLACEGHEMLHNEIRSPRNESIKSANFTSDAQMNWCKEHEQPVRAACAPYLGASNANAENSFYGKGIHDDKVGALDGEVSGNDRTSDHKKDLPMRKLKPENCSNARGTFGTVVEYLSPKDSTAEAAVGSCQGNFDFNSREHSDSTAKTSKFRDNPSGSPVAEHAENCLQSMYRGQSKENAIVAEYVEQTLKFKDPENVATIPVTGSSAWVKGVAAIKMNGINDDEEARAMTSNFIGVGFDSRLDCGTSSRQILFSDDINFNKYEAPNPTSNSGKESILLDKSEGRLDLENRPDSESWMQENGGWMLKSCSETKSVAKKNSRSRKRNRVQALRLKERDSALVCSEETKLEKNGRIYTPLVDSQGQFTLGTQISKSKNMKFVLAEEAVNLYLDAQVKTKCDRESVENEIFESKNSSVMIKVESKISPFLTELELTNLAVVNENPTLLKRDSSNDLPHLDTQTHFGNRKKKTKPQKKQKRPAEALESSCQLKENGSNYRSLLDSQTLYGNSTKKTKSQEKRKRPTETLQNTCQLKDDDADDKRCLDSLILSGSRKKNRRSQKKRKRCTKALESTCQLKEDGSDYRPLLDSQIPSGNGMTKTKSQKKRRRRAKALESTCHKINLEEGSIETEPRVLTKVSSVSSKMYAERANAEATELEAVGYSDSYAHTQVMIRKRKKSKKKRNSHVLEPVICCDHWRIESTCDTRRLEENSHLKDACSVTKNKQSKAERERKFSRALLRMSFIKFPKLVSTMVCPIRRHKSEPSKA